MWFDHDRALKKLMKPKPKNVETFRNKNRVDSFVSSTNFDWLVHEIGGVIPEVLEDVLGEFDSPIIEECRIVWEITETMKDRGTVFLKQEDLRHVMETFDPNILSSMIREGKVLTTKRGMTLKWVMSAGIDFDRLESVLETIKFDSNVLPTVLKNDEETIVYDESFNWFFPIDSFVDDRQLTLSMFVSSDRLGVESSSDVETAAKRSYSSLSEMRASIREFTGKNKKVMYLSENGWYDDWIHNRTMICIKNFGKWKLDDVVSITPCATSLDECMIDSETSIERTNVFKHFKRASNFSFQTVCRPELCEKLRGKYDFVVMTLNRADEIKDKWIWICRYLVENEKLMIVTKNSKEEEEEKNEAQTVMVERKA